MTQGNKYSIWLMPAGRIYTNLNNTIRGISREYGTPSFEPHVTLIGGPEGSKEEILIRTSQLARQIRPYLITLTSADYLDEYFRCLFVKVRKSKFVMNANLKASKIFNFKQYSTYSPHLSLMYGIFSIKEKKEIIKKIDGDLNIKFYAESLHLFYTLGDPSSWHRIKEFNLN